MPAINEVRAADPRPLAVWCCPRTLSHAFEMMMRSREDHVIFAEPFSDVWYHGPERQTHRTWLSQNSSDTYAGQLQKIHAAAESGRVFMRDMPFHLGKHFTREFFSQFQPAMQIRDPAYTLPSLYKIRPDFTELETGFGSLRDAWRLLGDMGESVPILDAIDLQRDPVTTVGLWCDAVGIARNTAALEWEPTFVKSWATWPEWTEKVRESCGFRPPPVEMPAVPNERVAKLIDSCRVSYREMELHKLR